MLIGLIKWFESGLDKGYGVIATPGNGSYFLHTSDFSGNTKDLSKSTAVVFFKKTKTHNDKDVAEKCRFFGTKSDWKLICEYMGTDDLVTIESDKRVGGRGNPYNNTNAISVSLVMTAVRQFFKGRGEDEVIEIITNYFDNNLDDSFFVRYCGIIEQAVKSEFSTHSSEIIMQKVFSHFGARLSTEILFNVWLNGDFRFIGYGQSADYEIPQSMLLDNSNLLGYSELKRIFNYPFAGTFFPEYFKARFKEIENLSVDELQALYRLLEFDNTAECENRKEYLNSIYGIRLKDHILRSADSLPQINSFSDLKEYTQLKEQIPEQVAESLKRSIEDEVDRMIIEKCAVSFRIELWIEEGLGECSIDLMMKVFLDARTSDERKKKIVARLDNEEQLEMLKEFARDETIEKAFSVLERIVRDGNSLPSNFKLVDVLHAKEFWEGKVGYYLVSGFADFLESECTDFVRFDYFFKGWVISLPYSIALENVAKMDKQSCDRICELYKDNGKLIGNLLVTKAIISCVEDLQWIFQKARSYLDENSFTQFDHLVFKAIDQAKYFELWEAGIARIIPVDYMESFFDDKPERYSKAEDWVTHNIITGEKLYDLFLSYLGRQIEVTDKVTFYRHFRFIQSVVQQGQTAISKIRSFRNKFYDLVLWTLDKIENLEFSSLKGKFIYFAPDSQVRIIRKLFFLHVQGKFDLTIDKLNEITRFDVDLYNISINYNPGLQIDISTDVVIKALISFQTNKRFLIENDLFAIILNDLHVDRTRKFKLSSYFENCPGRQIAEHDWKTEGEVRRQSFGNNQSYFAVTFSTGENKWVNNGWRSQNIFVPNPNFEKFKEAVRAIPGARWNAEARHWGIPLASEAEVLEFARMNRFFIDIGGSRYANNLHLVEFKRAEIPNGIEYCEGRLANIPHNTYGKEFWWCGGKACFSKCETIHQKEEWENYTLLDFCEILSFNTDEVNKMGDHIPKGHYYKFIALINRFNRLLERLYCKDCNHILYPLTTSHFAVHTVVRFHCVNELCSSNHEIYLTHCLNGQCNHIIDNRVSKTCKNGLHICDNCGSCCSHAMLSRRLGNLKTTGGKIHPNLIQCVEQRLGHLERAEYFCHKCADKMLEQEKDIFCCYQCDVRYDTTTYQLKRPHRHLKDGNQAINDDDDLHDFFA